MKMKKILVFGLSGLMTLSCAAPALAANTDTSVAASTVQAYAKNGLQKSGGYVFYYKNGKKVKNTTQKVKGKTYYFSSKGRGFLSVGNSTGNKAVASVIDGAKFKSNMNNKEKLKAAYDYILKKYNYQIADVPTQNELKNGKWVYKYAYNMVKDRDAKCYNWASLTGLTARALGYKTSIITGRAKRSADFKNQTEHAWALVNGKYVLDANYDDVNGKAGDQYFWKTYAQLKKSEGSEYTAEKKF